jgi:hypothetical protein
LNREGGNWYRPDPQSPRYGRRSRRWRFEEVQPRRGSGAPMSKPCNRCSGHASAAMTLEVYAGLFADDLDAVADRLDRVFANWRTRCGPNSSWTGPTKRHCPEQTAGQAEPLQSRLRESRLGQRAALGNRNLDLRITSESAAGRPQTTGPVCGCRLCGGPRLATGGVRCRGTTTWQPRRHRALTGNDLDAKGTGSRGPQTRRTTAGRCLAASVHTRDLPASLSLRRLRVHAALLPGDARSPSRRTISRRHSHARPWW